MPDEHAPPGPSPGFPSPPPVLVNAALEAAATSSERAPPKAAARSLDLILCPPPAAHGTRHAKSVAWRNARRIASLYGATDGESKPRCERGPARRQPAAA